MKIIKKFNAILHRLFYLGFAALLVFVLLSCEGRADKHLKTTAAESVIIAIKNENQFKKIWEKSGDQLLMFEFYADWCSPCKELAPVLEKIARQNRDKVTVYKINADRNSDLMYSFRVSGIPHVVFVRNKENVFSLTGVYPKKMYLKIIDQFSGPITNAPVSPDKEIDAERAT